MSLYLGNVPKQLNRSRHSQWIKKNPTKQSEILSSAKRATHCDKPEKGKKKRGRRKGEEKGKNQNKKLKDYNPVIPALASR